MVNACLKLIVFSPSLSQLYYSFEKCFLLVPESHWQGKEEAHLSACRAAQGILSAHTGTWRSTLCMLEVVILPVSKGRSLMKHRFAVAWLENSSKFS